MKLYDLEPERIPAPHLGVLRGFPVDVLDTRDPVRELRLGSAGGPLPLDVAHLRQIRDSAPSLEEAHRGHLRADTRTVSVDIQRGFGIARIPLGIPGLVALRAMERTTFPVVALAGRKI